MNASRLFRDFSMESDCSRRVGQYASASMAFIRPSICPRIIFARCKARDLSFWLTMVMFLSLIIGGRGIAYKKHIIKNCVVKGPRKVPLFVTLSVLSGLFHVFFIINVYH